MCDVCTEALNDSTVDEHESQQGIEVVSLSRLILLLLLLIVSVCYYTWHNTFFQYNKCNEIILKLSYFCWCRTGRCTHMHIVPRTSWRYEYVWSVSPTSHPQWLVMSSNSCIKSFLKYRMFITVDFNHYWQIERCTCFSDRASYNERADDNVHNTTDTTAGNYTFYTKSHLFQKLTYAHVTWKI